MSRTSASSSFPTTVGPRQDPADSAQRAVTQCLERWQSGDTGGLDELLPVVYDDLRRLASSLFAGERQDHTLQPTALLHDVYLELSRENGRHFANRGELFGFVATLMRRALIDHSRSRLAAKRGGGARHEPLESADHLVLTQPKLFLDLDRALQALGEVDAEAAELVELRFFTGMTLQEIATDRGLSVSSLTRRWRVARAMLRRLLEGQPNAS